MNVKELAKVLPDVLSISGDTDVEINSVAYDSRKVKDNGIFVAISGTNFDGHDFIPEAIKGGAKVIIGEKEMDIGNILYIRVKDARKALARTSAWFYGYPGDKLKIIGVTGTSGKTTITYLISEMLKEVGCRFGVIGTIGNVINGRKLPASLTTPESLELNRLFAEMLEHNTEYAVMEVSSHSLKLNRVTDLSFKVGIFTNLTQDHLDFHKDFDDYFLSKKKLFQQSEKAVINIDDKSGAKLLGM
jgi:UDP-N-acetylmuramoyl-L-alanyl-D-glutamate--2,6-diaminopimelate ligase